MMNSSFWFHTWKEFQWQSASCSPTSVDTDLRICRLLRWGPMKWQRSWGTPAIRTFDAGNRKICAIEPLISVIHKRRKAHLSPDASAHRLLRRVPGQDRTGDDDTVTSLRGCWRSARREHVNAASFFNTRVATSRSLLSFHRWRRARGRGKKQPPFANVAKGGRGVDMRVRWSRSQGKKITTYPSGSNSQSRESGMQRKGGWQWGIPRNSN